MIKILFFVLLSGTAIVASIIELPQDLTDQDEVPQKTDDEKETSHIVGGNNADRAEYPWLISLGYNGAFRCGGSILDVKTILTAAHCVEDDRKQRYGDFSIKAGDYKTFKVEDSEQIRRVKKVIMHKKYNKKSKYDRDIAILKLKDPLELNEYVQAVPLATQTKEDELLSSPKCFVAGIGDTEDSKSNINIYSAVPKLSKRILVSRVCLATGPFIKSTQEVSASMLSRQDCLEEAAYYEPKITAYMLCSLDSLKGACSGDSGGPLTCYDENDNPYQVGIVSWGSANCWSGFNVYARVSNLKKWIKRYLE